MLGEKLKPSNKLK